MISVVVPARDAADTLAECLVGLRAQSLPAAAYEIILADDGSADDTAAIGEAHGARVLRLPPGGPAAARNAGAQAACGEIVAFTDADCVPAPDWLAQLTWPFADSEVVGVKGAYRTRQPQLVARFVQQEYQDKYDRMARRPTIDFIDTYSAAYRRAVLLENGGFETAFPAPSVEDQELSFRLARKGYKLVFAPAAIVYHRHDRSLREYARRKFGIGYWKAYLLRWHPEKALGDSHTPLAQRIQLVLMAAGLAGLLVAPLEPHAAWISLIALLAFFVSAAPLGYKIARREPPVLVVAPALLIARAGALGAGLIAGAIGLLGRGSPRRAVIPWRASALKWTMDMVVAVVGLILALPFLAIASLLIKMDSPGPVLFVQARTGQNGKPFRMYKLRTMVPGADAMFDGVAAANPLKGSAVKLPQDPRVTRVGRWLRRWSVDELPQLWNVLRGDMSLVGPRPEEPRIVAEYNDWHRQRLAVKPGLTGPMQVHGRGHLSLDERVRLEIDYIEHYTLWRDVAILVRSIPAVISGRGAY